MKLNFSGEMFSMSVSRFDTRYNIPPVSCGTFMRMVPVVVPVLSMRLFTIQQFVLAATTSSRVARLFSLSK